MNTKEISLKLDVSEETVRRWIRSGKLKACKTSRKHGYIITEKDYYEFKNSRSEKTEDCDLRDEVLRLITKRENEIKELKLLLKRLG